jgi:ABC-type transporter lipoprotein component MlaA
VGYHFKEAVNRYNFYRLAYLQYGDYREADMEKAVKTSKEDTKGLVKSSYY